MAAGRLVAILPAAGSSSRMGRPKLLLPLRDRHRADLLEVPVEDAGTVMDVDTPEDYERASSGSLV